MDYRIGLLLLALANMVDFGQTKVGENSLYNIHTYIYLLVFIFVCLIRIYLVLYVSVFICIRCVYLFVLSVYNIYRYLYLSVCIYMLYDNMRLSLCKACIYLFLF